MAKKLLVIGAGPKAMALAAKATALAAAGYSVPEVTIIERNGYAANWVGRHGYTDGEQPLGTPPDKDVGFPYLPTFGDKVIDIMLANYSWGAFLCSNAGGVGEWVDRGRHHPSHREWGAYLSWVASKVNARYLEAEVESADISGEMWRVRCRTKTGTTFEVYSDGLVVTGPGEPLQVRRQQNHHTIFDGKSFWLNLDKFNSLDDESSVCVIGSGETAASVVVELVNRFRSTNPPAIHLINRQGTIFSRGEGFLENTIFTDPSNWNALKEDDRRKIIGRTDRGVFSLSSLSTINKARNVLPLTAEVTDIYIEKDNKLGGEEMPHVLGDYNGEWLIVPVNYVVVAIGFDPWSFTGLLTPLYRDRLNDIEMRKKVIPAITYDLCAPSAIVPAKLHVPMLAGLAQGPGFPNLSCLGTLADRILKSYLV